MSTYVLIHGAWHGAWCWYKLIPRLQRAGHRVLAPDLPSLGRDRTPPGQVTLASWVEFVCALLDAQREPVVLVGHSRAGIVISQVAEQRPDKIRTLVYLTAFLPRTRESLSQLAAMADSIVNPNIVVSEDRSSCYVRDEVLRDAFYGCCSEEDVTLARMLLCSEPMAPLISPVTLSDENYGRVPRVYIECLRDGGLLPSLQKRMYTASPCRQVLAIDTDHSPFLSRPDELAAHLLSL